MKFYRIEDTELNLEGVSVYAFYVFPERLEIFLNMMDKFKDIHQLGKPELVEVEIGPKGGFLPIEGEKNVSIFVGPG